MGPKTWSKVVFQVFVIIALVTTVRAFNWTSDSNRVEDKGTSCDIPKTDPFSPEVMQFDKKLPIICPGIDWVKCYLSTCKPVPETMVFVKDMECIYRDILYINDDSYEMGPNTVFEGEHEYKLDKSDHVDILCKVDKNKETVFGTTWRGHGAAFRPLTPKKPPPGRETTYNVLIFGFDSGSKNLIIRKLPKTYKFLKEKLNSVILNGYNVVGDGTTANLLPLLTGKIEPEVPQVRKGVIGSQHVDSMPFIFYKLKEDGYRTAYFEDTPLEGTFQYCFNGFLHQPTDHYLRDFYLEVGKYNETKKVPYSQFCVGGTPMHKLMINLTDQFFQLDGKKFGFTFVSDISHNDPNYLGNADVDLVELLQGLLSREVFRNTLFILMGDHGTRYGAVRQTWQGKLEERLPFMAIRLPDDLVSHRPDTLDGLKQNADVLTTPHDIHATLLDVLDMRQHYNPYKVEGAAYTRGLTLLKGISKNRTCSEAGVENHWCTCLKWESVKTTDPMYNRTAVALVDYINSITAIVRYLCAPRNLTSIQWVMRKAFDFNNGEQKTVYQVKIEVGPSKGVYEATVSHYLKIDQLFLHWREISRTNRYGDEPACIIQKYPSMRPYCYCIV